MMQSVFPVARCVASRCGSKKNGDNGESCLDHPQTQIGNGIHAHRKCMNTLTAGYKTDVTQMSKRVTKHWSEYYPRTKEPFSVKLWCFGVYMELLAKLERIVKR